MVGEPTERRGFPGGLRAQLLLGLAVLLLGTVALVAVLVIQVAKRQIIRTEVDHTKTLARQLAMQGAREPDIRTVSRFVNATGVEYASLVLSEADAKGRSSLAGGTLPNSRTRNPFADLTPGQSRTADIAGEPYVLAAVDIHAGGAPAVDSARVARSLSSAYGRVTKTRTLLLVYLGLDAFFILIVGYGFLTYFVVRPIRAIGTATQRAARGDLASHIELLPANEFGRVGRSFNRMLDELRENRRELKERLEELDAAYTELEQTQESLIRSEKLASVGQLAAGVAHEVGNPLAAIRGYADFLSDEDPDDLDLEDYRDMLERIQKQTDRIQTIIRDLLDFSRDSSDDQPIGPTNLRRCVKEAMDLVEPQPRARGVEFIDELPDDLPKVRANADQVVQVLVNLLINAADAIRAEAKAEGETPSQRTGEVQITARPREDGGVDLRVSDDGPGIPEEDRQTIFDPFYTTKEPGEGTGLGLAISARILERFGGEIRVESEVGEGTTFVLAFPACS